MAYPWLMCFNVLDVLNTKLLFIKYQLYHKFGWTFSLLYISGNQKLKEANVLGEKRQSVTVRTPGALCLPRKSSPYDYSREVSPERFWRNKRPRVSLRRLKMASFNLLFFNGGGSYRMQKSADDPGRQTAGWRGQRHWDGHLCQDRGGDWKN